MKWISFLFSKSFHKISGVSKSKVTEGTLSCCIVPLLHWSPWPDINYALHGFLFESYLHIIIWSALLYFNYLVKLLLQMTCFNFSIVHIFWLVVYVALKKVVFADRINLKTRYIEVKVGHYLLFILALKKNWPLNELEEFIYMYFLFSI